MRLIGEARLYWPHIGCIFLLGLVSAGLALLTPLPFKIAVDSLIGAHPLPGFLARIVPEGATRFDTTLLLVVAGLMVVIASLDQLQRLIIWVLSIYTGERLVLGFRARLFHHVQRLSLSYHDSRGTADSLYRIQSDAHAIQTISIFGVTPFISAGLTVLGMVYVTAQLDGQLALIALAVSPAIFLTTWVCMGRLRTGWEITKALESKALSVVHEALAGLRVVKAFGQEGREQKRFIGRSRESVRARVRLALAEGGFTALPGLATAIGTALVLFIGVRHVQAGLLTLGDLVLVMAYLAQLYVPLQEIGRSITTLQSSLASAERAFALLDEPADVAERPDARPISRAAGAIAFRNVSFAYDGRDPVLRDVSVEIPPGTRLGISGTTGVGKTTLASLLMRFYDPTEGQILLDGIDLRDYKLADLRNQFAIVLQEPVLFSTNMAENIAYARPEASEQEVVEAAKAANAHEFILALPDGYNTLVGERGIRLSGGERQRISLARAFLKKASILILDEPTSSVDIKTEAAIMEAMERLMHGRTTIMIAHRLSTLANCDALLEIKNDRLSRVTRSMKDDYLTFPDGNRGKRE